MKISLPFVLVLLRFPHNKTSLFAMQLLIFFVCPQQQLWFWAHFKPVFSLAGGGLKWTFSHLVASQPSGFRHFRAHVPIGTLVGSNGLGPSTSRLSGVCSNQLSYEPIMVEVIGFEPMTPCLQGRCSTS